MLRPEVCRAQGLQVGDCRGCRARLAELRVLHPNVRVQGRPAAAVRPLRRHDRRTGQQVPRSEELFFHRCSAKHRAPRPLRGRAPSPPRVGGRVLVCEARVLDGRVAFRSGSSPLRPRGRASTSPDGITTLGDSWSRSGGGCFDLAAPRAFGTEVSVPTKCALELGTGPSCTLQPVVAERWSVQMSHSQRVHGWAMLCPRAAALISLTIVAAPEYGESSQPGLARVQIERPREHRE
mmetsp:Transcript_121066/g.387567  ORF Transcript_121066/g.387567 Transcript_121066/m.387567 type:complete len:236 (-) Transcript_121066:374-1081(-)